MAFTKYKCWRFPNIVSKFIEDILLWTEPMIQIRLNVINNKSTDNNWVYVIPFITYRYDWSFDFVCYQ